MKDVNRGQRWLIVISATLLLVFSAVLYIQFHQSRLLSNTLRMEEDNLAWSFFQLETESLRLREALLDEINQPEAIDRDKLQLRFDIFFSRFGVVMDGRGAALLASYEQFDSTVALLRVFFGATESYFSENAATTRDAQAMRTMFQGLEQLRDPLRELSLAANGMTGARAEARAHEVQRQIAISTGLILFQSALTLLFSIIVIRQIRQLEARRIDLGALAGQLEQSNRALHERANALTVALGRADRSFSELSSYIQAIDQHALVSITDGAGFITQVNDKFIATCGYSREELLGQDHRLLNSGLHDKAFMTELWDTLARNDVWRGEFCNRTKLGTLIWSDCAIVPLQNSHQSEARFISVSIDITERKAIETELLSAMRLAEAANRAKSEFLANMSHEIRTPMNGILGMTELAIATKNKQDQHDYLRLVKSSADSLLIIVNDILDFSKIEAGQMTLEHIPFTLQDVLPDIIKSTAVRMDHKDVELLHEIHPAVAHQLVGDPERLRQIVLNLLGNAVKFTARGEIVLAVAPEPSPQGETVLHFSVRDTGIGIPQNKQESIFDAFSQADGSTTRKYGGTGLGLSICSRLVGLMGGKIWLDSEPGAGSTFHFTARFGLGADAGAVAGPPQLDGLPVLIVDDNATHRRILSNSLRRWNMHPTAVDSGEQALAVLASARAQGGGAALLLLDEKMPGMDGATTAKRIRGNADLDGTTIIMMTSSPTAVAAVHRRELGIAAFLTKPVTQSGLLEAIQAALGMANDNAQGLATSAVQSETTVRLAILLVEDNAINQQLAIVLLEKAGHHVTVAENGCEALKALERDNYDLVLMDMQMPEMGGIEATVHIRENERQLGGHIPIIAMTANAMDNDRERCLAAGMDDYVSKPITSARLFAAIDAVVRTQHLGKPGPERKLPDGPDGKLPVNGFDYAAAIAQSDAEILAIIGAMTVEAIPQNLFSIESALLQGSEEEIRRAAHTLKGALRYFGAKPAVEWARKMEAHAAEGQIDAARTCFKPLQQELEKFQPVAAAIFTAPNG